MSQMEPSLSQIGILADVFMAPWSLHWGFMGLPFLPRNCRGIWGEMSSGGWRFNPWDRDLLFPWSGGLVSLSRVPSGKHTKSYCKLPFIVDFPIKNAYFPYSYACFSRGYPLLLQIQTRTSCVSCKPEGSCLKIRCFRTAIWACTTDWCRSFSTSRYHSHLGYFGMKSKACWKQGVDSHDSGNPPVTRVISRENRLT